MTLPIIKEEIETQRKKKRREKKHYSQELQLGTGKIIQIAWDTSLCNLFVFVSLAHVNKNECKLAWPYTEACSVCQATCNRRGIRNMLMTAPQGKLEAKHKGSKVPFHTKPVIARASLHWVNQWEILWTYEQVFFCFTACVFLSKRWTERAVHLKPEH